MTKKLIIKQMKLIILQLSVFLLIASCSQQKKQAETVTEPNYSSKSFSEKLIGIAQSSVGFANTMVESGIEFTDEIVNNPYEYRDYKADLNISAANIAIYAADAQYLKAYGFQEKANLSSKSAKKLLKLIKGYKLDTSLSKIQKGYKTADSAFFVLNNALKDSVNKLTEIERKQYLFSLMLGSFIEKNYLILNALNNNFNYNEPKVQKVLRLLKNLNDQLQNILMLRNKFINTDYKNYMRNDLIKYNAYYTENSNTLIQGHNQQAVKTLINNLLTQISEMRNYIIYADILVQ